MTNIAEKISKEIQKLEKEFDEADLFTAKIDILKSLHVLVQEYIKYAS